MKKILCILLLSWNLIQFSSAKSSAFNSNEDYLKAHDLCQQKENYAVMAPEEKDSNISPSIQLLKMTLHYLQDSALTYARKAKTISELLMKEPAICENHSEEMQNFKQKIEKYLKIYMECNGMEELFKLMDLYVIFTLDYYKMEKEKNLTEDGKIILDILKKYDYENMNVEYESSLNLFVTSFGNKFDEIEEELKKEEGELPGKIIQWWEVAKNVKDYQDRFLEMIRFMRLYKENKLECHHKVCEIFNNLEL